MNVVSIESPSIFMFAIVNVFEHHALDIGVISAQYITKYCSNSFVESQCMMLIIERIFKWKLCLLIFFPSINFNIKSSIFSFIISRHKFLVLQWILHSLNFSYGFTTIKHVFQEGGWPCLHRKKNLGLFHTSVLEIILFWNE